MGRKWSPDTIPDSTVLHGGAYLFSIEGIEEKQSQSGKAMYVGTFRVVEPTAFAGLPYYENFVIGTDDDPACDDPKTLETVVGARILKRVLKAANIEMGDDLDDCCEGAKDQQVVGLISQVVDDGARDARYKGRIRNVCQGWYTPGERAIGLDGSESAAAPARPAAPRATVPAKAAPKPVSAARPAAPVARPTAAATRAKPTPGVKCGICGEEVARAEFAKHVETHGEEE